MMDALGAIAAEPGEVPDCNCSFILFYFNFFHAHTHIPPTPQVHVRTREAQFAGSNSPFC